MTQRLAVSWLTASWSSQSGRNHSVLRQSAIMPLFHAIGVLSRRSEGTYHKLLLSCWATSGSATDPLTVAGLVLLPKEICEPCGDSKPACTNPASWGDPERWIRSRILIERQNSDIDTSLSSVASAAIPFFHQVRVTCPFKRRLGAFSSHISTCYGGALSLAWISTYRQRTYALRSTLLIVHPR